MLFPENLEQRSLYFPHPPIFRSTFSALLICIVSGHLTCLRLEMLLLAKSLQSCPTLCDPTDGSPPGSPVPGILQARTLEWVAISFSNAWKLCPILSNPMDCSSPGSSVHGIFQARVLEWGAIAFSVDLLGEQKETLRSTEGGNVVSNGWLNME